MFFNKHKEITPLNLFCTSCSFLFTNSLGHPVLYYWPWNPVRIWSFHDNTVLLYFKFISTKTQIFHRFKKTNTVHICVTRKSLPSNAKMPVTHLIECFVRNYVVVKSEKNETVITGNGLRQMKSEQQLCTGRLDQPNHKI